TSELDIFVGNTTLIDEDVYRLWLDGYSQTRATAAVLQSDSMDHYRTFHRLERPLHAPPKLYYAFDEAFVWEVLGKKLSKGTKKHLDDISTKTGITLKSCRRQFENMKRVFKVVEEMQGSLTGRKKLQYLSFGDFAFCAELMIQNWTLGAVDSQLDDMDVDLDKEFLHDLKELKVLVADKDRIDLHKSLVCTALRGKLGVFSEMEANFKNLSRGLVNVAATMTHNKDVRALFVDLVEKFVEPCRSDHRPLNDVRLFLNHYSASVHSLDGFQHQALWDRSMGTLRGCLLCLYHD
ncbi:hypothetical protein FD754_013586, partial [Muntiacus muntjak]